MVEPQDGRNHKRKGAWVTDPLDVGSPWPGAPTTGHYTWEGQWVLSEELLKFGGLFVPSAGMTLTNPQARWKNVCNRKKVFQVANDKSNDLGRSLHGSAVDEPDSDP